MKTALTELIEELKLLSAQCSTNTVLDRRIKGAYVNAVMKAKALLAKEKRQLKNAYDQGHSDGDIEDYPQYKNSEEYFNQTFLSND